MNKIAIFSFENYAANRKLLGLANGPPSFVLPFIKREKKKKIKRKEESVK